MDIRSHRMRAAIGLVTSIIFLSLVPHPACGQGFLRGYCPPCYCQSACNCGNGSTGAAGSASAGSPTDNQYADSQFDLGEAGPAQIGSSFAAVDSAYIDDARIRNMFRFRADAAYNNPFPDRAEFFYAQCGCFGQGAPGPGVTSAATNVNYQEFWMYGESALSDRFSVFIDVPFRLVDIDVNVPGATGPAAAQIPNSAGLSDIQLGFKYAFVADPNRYDTFQLRVYTPTGDADRGLGTHHVSLEPAYLIFRRLTQRFRVNGEFRAWIPISDSVNPVNGRAFAGPILRYGLGGSYDLWQACDCSNDRVSAVVEFVGWSVLSGQKFNPLFPNDTEAAGDTIFNVKVGGRWVFGNQSLYAGYGHALTSQVWYTDIIRAEYTYQF